MRQAGRVHWITISGLLGAAVLIVLLFFSSDSPTSVANKFMSALAKGDVDTLVALSNYEGPPEKLRKDWEYAVHVAGPHYMFRWWTVTAKEHDANNAAVLTRVERNLGPSSYDEQVDIPVVRVNGTWKVEVRALFKGLYPALPR